jgi:hypothetical protein
LKNYCFHSTYFFYKLHSKPHIAHTITSITAGFSFSCSSSSGEKCAPSFADKPSISVGEDLAGELLECDPLEKGDNLPSITVRGDDLADELCDEPITFIG